jgi:hypothetical protein
MTFDLFLSSSDAMRVRRVIAKLALYDFREFAITGGLAVETHCIGLGHAPRVRALNDLDTVVESFGAIPGTLARTFLCRHIHPKAPEGKTLLQLVDPSEGLRIDVFRAFGATMARRQSVTFQTGPIQMVSIEDLAAREARLVMDLECGSRVPLKHAQDFERLAETADADQVEIAWRDHRRETDPLTFQEASIRIRELVRSHGDLLIVPDYSHDGDAVCPKCEETGPFRLASPRAILPILGYC